MLIKRLLLLVTSLIIAHTSYAEPLSSITFFSPRPQTTDAALELIDDCLYIYNNEVKSSHLFISTIGYYQSLHPNQLALMIFGTELLVVEGSFIQNREDSALLADYFGLSPSFQGAVHISPHWQSLYLPFTFYFNLDDWLCGLYLRVCAPFVWNRSHLKLTETVTNNGADTLFPADYMDAIPVAAPYTSFPEALVSGKTYGLVKEPLFFGKYAPCSQSTERLANTTWDLGWNAILEEDRHFGFKMRVVTPNGTRPTGEFLFEPLAGNRHQWELGFGLNAHTLLWCDDDQALSIYLNLLMTHLFSGKQRRPFDIKRACSGGQRFFSRYMLVKEFDDDGAFSGVVSPLINHTTLACDVNVAVEFDGALMFAYAYKQLNFDVGYNGWIRSKEKISLCEGLPHDRFGLKGIQNVINTTGQLSPVTQSTASIFGNNFAAQHIVADPNSPVFLNTENIDISSARSPVVFSHKLFTYIGYTGGKLHKHRSVQPCIGIGSEIEFQGINTNNDDLCKMDQLTLSQWSVFLKAGFLFG